MAPALHGAPVPTGDAAAAFKPTLTLHIQPPEQVLSDVRFVAGLIARLAPTEKDVKEFQSEAKSAKDPEVKNFAQSTLPTLEEHLKMAKQAEAAAKGEKTASK